MTETTIKERPILFSAAMVRAILAGTKTQTRRLVTGSTVVENRAVPVDKWLVSHSRCPYRVGENLWVRETWRPKINHHCGYPGGVCDCDDVYVTYAADGAIVDIDWDSIQQEWTMPKAAKRGNVTPLHMPRWASRINLEIESVRVERVQDISEADAIAEGVPSKLINDPMPDAREWWSPLGYCTTAKHAFAEIWRDINGRNSWDENPWVWVIGFKVSR